MVCLRHILPSSLLLLLWSSWLWLALPAVAQQKQTFFPASVPLAVRSPTFNCWLDVHNGSNPMASWPQFWNDKHILGWAGYIKVDGQTYHWLGDPVGNASTWLSTQVTPTRTILTVQAGPMQLNVTFLSPIEPSDWAKQSFPFSYVYVDGKSTDGKVHSVQLYSDISGEWVTGSFGTGIQWSTTRQSNTVYHQVQSTSPRSEFTDVAEDSVAYYAISSGQPNLVSVIGTDQALRPQFASQGSKLSLSSDLAGQIGNVQGGDGKFPVLAHALDLGNTDTIATVAWAVGLIRDPVVTFANVPRRAYYWSQHASIGDAIDTFMADFPAARTRALALDQQILQDASAVSAQYADLVSLATRQAMAGIEITLSTLNNGSSFNLSDVKAFMKDVGNSQRVNPVETIYAALPVLMYLNSSITGLLLEPLLEYQSSSSYGYPYAAPDLGISYPSVPGNANNNDVYGVENSGNMLILVLAHAQSSGDGSLIGRYYDLLKKWGDYLGTNALVPSQQTSADARNAGLSQTHGNVTNLALKGIIAIQAMSEISQIAGQNDDAQKYRTMASSLIQSWDDLSSVSPSQLRWTYGASTWGLMYNLLADKLLKLNFVPSSIYTAQSSTISTNVKQSQLPFGPPLSSDSNSNARSGSHRRFLADWTLFSAAAADNATRDLLISGAHGYASSNLSSSMFATLYNIQSGSGPGSGVSPNGYASPAQGAVFSVLALNRLILVPSVANKTVIVPPSTTSPSASPSSSTGHANSHTGAIAGGVIGGLAAVLLLGLAAVVLRRRRRNRDGQLEAPRPYQEQPTMAAYGTAPTLNASSPATPIVPPSRMFLASGSPKPGAQYADPEPLSPSATSPPASSHQPPSSNGSGAGSSRSHGTDASLRNEMQRLRQEVELLRGTQGVPQEAPPEYH
ncbi:hypothetical protein R3P38DRAFT_2763069 [Favolaschia claudopus]|uniref:DUF1793-domain-containing protein n=1 Tax=Favolaschia claudopus TaxID=2862362 RepID=A0AAW0DMZ9_9AGAR